MIVDSSAIMAILLDEPEQEAFLRHLDEATTRRISAGTWIELTVVISRRRDDRLFAALDLVMADFPLEIVAVTPAQARIGADAYRKYGKGNHRARLNYGDCFAYALARETGDSLLFKGDDFVHTDVRAA